jgi:hypothetical protein
MMDQSLWTLTIGERQRKPDGSEGLPIVDIHDFDAQVTWKLDATTTANITLPDKQCQALKWLRPQEHQVTLEREADGLRLMGPITDIAPNGDSGLSIVANDWTWWAQQRLAGDAFKGSMETVSAMQWALNTAISADLPAFLPDAIMKRGYALQTLNVALGDPWWSTFTSYNAFADWLVWNDVMHIGTPELPGVADVVLDALDFVTTPRIGWSTTQSASRWRVVGASKLAESTGSLLDNYTAVARTGPSGVDPVYGLTERIVTRPDLKSDEAVRQVAAQWATRGGQPRATVTTSALRTCAPVITDDLRPGNRVTLACDDPVFGEMDLRTRIVSTTVNIRSGREPLDEAWTVALSEYDPEAREVFYGA